MYIRVRVWYSSIMTTNEDLARIAHDDEQYAAWEREHADTIARDAYEAWASDARADGEDDSEDAYVAHLERMMPDE